MNAELTPQQKFHAEPAERMIPRMLAQGCSDEEMLDRLLELDWSRHAAISLIGRFRSDYVRFVQSPESRAALRHECRAQFVRGLLLIFCSLLVLAVTFFAVAGGGFPFCLILIGPFVYGCIAVRRGNARLYLFREGKL